MKNELSYIINDLNYILVIMKIYKALKVRIYPNQEQIQILNKNLGACRAFYNMMLFERKEVYEKFKDNKRKLYEYKYKTSKQYREEFPWLSDQISSQALNNEIKNLKNAYSNFFKSLLGKRKGERSGFPKFKKKKNECSYSVCPTMPYAIQVNYETSKVKLPILSWVKFKDGNRKFEGIIKKATVRRTSTGKYYVSVLYEQEFEPNQDLNISQSKAKIVGLDMSLEKFFVDDQGNSPAYERLYRKFEPRLKMLQKRVDKKKRGSQNQKKAQHKVNRVHEKISNKRKDFTHKLSTQLIRENDVIVVENLSLKGMSQALNLGKSVMDLGYSEFIRQLQYKSFWYNKIFIEADRWFASSKTCSKCGFKYSELKLSERSWICPSCGIDHNRDQNAGMNLKNYGLDILGLNENKIGQGMPEFTPVENSMHEVESVKQEVILEVLYD